MPFYDYKCAKCGHIFEIKKGMDDRTDPKCPKCSADARRIFSVPMTSGSSGGGGSCQSCNTGGCTTCGGH